MVVLIDCIAKELCKFGCSIARQEEPSVNSDVCYASQPLQCSCPLLVGPVHDRRLSVTCYKIDAVWPTGASVRPDLR